ncbi:MAG: hypothetical protein GX445_07180 [Elusimicrobia bacterium]|nr:hypothetical protein [Elusimicrobiota bacterium]
MDIIYKLRIAFWFLVVLIWGIYLYQYISTDIKDLETNKIILNGERRSSTPQRGEKKNQDYSQPEIITTIQSTITYQQNNSLQQNRIMLANTDEIKEIIFPEEGYKTEEAMDDKTKPSVSGKINEIPEGFDFKQTRHFNLYVEKGIDINEIESLIENLHGEIMIDLIAFSPWTRDTKVTVYLTKTSTKYQEISKRPAWSGGATNLKDKIIYLYKSDEWFGILAHELTHIYFDSFFGSYDKSPLWLSEGMAVYIQVERGKSSPQWLNENLSYLKDGAGYNLSDLIMIKTLDDADEKSVKLWYAQSFSLVYLLLKIQHGDSFYQFCKRIKAGDSVSKALYLSYGKPYTTLAALESIWRYQIKTETLIPQK